MKSLMFMPAGSADTEQQLIFLLQGMLTRRWHTEPMLQDVTVGHHSAGVAWMCWLLTDYACGARLLMAALAHDMPERITGDMPAPTKRALNMEAAFLELEQRVLSDNNALFVISKEELAVLRMADCMQGLLECVHERTLGSRYLVEPAEFYLKRLSAMPMNERQNAVYKALRLLWQDANPISDFLKTKGLV